MALDIINASVLFCTFACLVTIVNAGVEEEWFWPQKPNIIIFYADDVGWADFSSFGHPTQEWGPIDNMFIDGKRFTNFYSTSALCSPSRAGLLTGRLPQRSGVNGHYRVFTGSNVNGLPREEITIPEALKDAGYVTGMVGKWHLGVNAHSHNDGEHLPYNHGFDYVGTNFGTGNSWSCDEEQWHMDEPSVLGCVLYKNATIIQQPYSHYGLGETLVNDAVGFIRDSQDGPPPHRKPFFLYYALTQTHTDLYSSNEGFRGSSQRGIMVIKGRYGDNINEMSWEVGAVLDEVKSLGLDSNTLSIFSSDNGPWLQLCNEGGDAGVLKGGKMQFWEGGIRVPTIWRWPGHIRPATTSNALTSMTDIFPTLMNIAGGSVPDDRIMDGQDISSLLFNWSPEPQPEPVAMKGLYKEHEVLNSEPRMLVFYCESTLYAVRYGNFKFHFHTQKALTKEGQHAEPGRCGEGGFPLQSNSNCGGCYPNWRMPESCFNDYDTPLMFDVGKDPNEAYPLNTTLPQHQVVLDEMMVKLDEFLDTMVLGPRLLDLRSTDNIPCCTPESFPDCECNYSYEGPLPKPGNPNPTFSSKKFDEMILNHEFDEQDVLWVD